MSTEIDERVVSMKFNNTNFEKNISTTMASLDKFKNKLKLDGACSGIENINKAASNLNLSGMTNAVDTVKKSFSTLEIMGITAIANLTNSAVNMGKRLATQFTTQPIFTGFQEYETKIGAIQTIMSNTESKGTKMSEITKTLDELNTYADKTIYNFAEMTRNIGTFTAAGIGLKDAASSIKGIANLAASSGSTSQQASVAMYQLSQAMASGTVKLMDWNSVVNAGMGGKLFQEALKKTAREQGIAVDDMIKKAGSFRESLEQGWITTDVLNKTLNNFTVDGAKKYADAMIKSGKYTKEQALDLRKQAKSMEDAATKVKTFSQLLDTLKEAAQSGWAQTWETIIGNFTQSKELFTDLSNQFGKMIDVSSKARNNLLADTLDSKWDILLGKLKLAGIGSKDFTKILKKTAKENGVDVGKLIKDHKSLAKAIDNGAISSDIFIKALKNISTSSDKVIDSSGNLSTKLKDFQKTVDKVWNGDYDNGAERVKALSKEGYNYKSIQSLVNKTVDGHRLTLKELNKEQIIAVSTSKNLSDKQLESIGFNKKQIASLRDLSDQAEKTGTPLNELIKSLEKPSGRNLLIDILKNSINMLVKPISAIKKAWHSTFEASPKGLYNLIDSIKDLTEKFTISDKNAENLSKTFGGIFSIFKLVGDVVGTVVKTGFNLLFPAVDKGTGSFLNITGAIGDSITKFRIFIEKNNIITTGISKIGDVIKGAITHIKNFITAFKNIPIVSKAIDNFKDNIKDMAEVGKNIIKGLKNGVLNESISLPDIFKNIGSGILTSIKKVLGIHSPSKEMEDVGSNIIKGLVKGIRNGFDVVIDLMGRLGETIGDTLKNIPWGKLIAGAITAGTVIIGKKMADTIENFSQPAKGLGDMLSSTGSVLENFAFGIKRLSKALSFSLKLKGIKDLAIAIVLLVGAVAILTLLDPKKVWSAVGVVAALGGIIVGLAVVADTLTKSSKTWNGGIVDAVKMGSMITALGISLLLMSAVVLIISKMNPTEAKRGFVGLTTLLVLLEGCIVTIGILSKDSDADAVKRFGKMVRSLSISLLLMTLVIKILGSMDIATLLKGGIALGYMSIIVSVISVMANKTDAKKLEHFSKVMKSIGIAFLLMTASVKILGGMKTSELLIGLGALTAMSGVIAILVQIGKKAGTGSQIYGIAKLFSAIGTSLLVMAIVVRLLGGMDPASLLKGEIALGGIVLMITMLIKVTKIAGNSAPKIAAVLLAASASIVILSGVVIALSMIDPDGMKNGLSAVRQLAMIMAGLITVSKHSKGSTGGLVAMSVAIGILAASLVILSFIDPTKLAVATMSIGIVMLMLMLVIKSTKNVKGSMGSLIAMTVLIALLSGSIILLSRIDPTKAIVSTAALSLLMIALVVCMNKINEVGSFSKKTVASLGVMMIVMSMLTGMILLLSLIPSDKIIPASIALSLVLVSLSASMLLLSKIKSVSGKAIASLAVMGLVIAALSGLILAIVSLEDVKPQTVAVGLLAIAGVFAILGAAAFILQPVIVVVLALAASILMIGGAMLAAGTGMYMFSNSLPILAVGIGMVANAISKHGQTIADGIFLLATTVISLIPILATAIGNGIIAFATVIGNGAPVIGQAIISIITAIVMVITTTAPLVLNAFGVVLVSFMKMLSDTIPKLVTLGMQMIKGILRGIADNIQGIVEAAIDIIVNFIKGVTSKIPDVIDAAFKLVISFINGLADAIDNNSDAVFDAVKRLFKSVVSAIGRQLEPAIDGAKKTGKKVIGGLKEGVNNAIDSFKEFISGFCDKVIEFFTSGFEGIKDVGSNIVNGLKEGITSGIDGVTGAASKVSNKVLSTVQSIFDIHSPSRVFRKIGSYLMIGLKNGIVDFSSVVTSATKNVGDKTVTTIQKAMNGLYSGLSNINLDDVNPTITPVLDLTNIQSGYKKMNNLLNNQINVGLVGRANSISMINGNRQNGIGDLLSSIKEQKDNTGTTTINHYHVNGVTYDDGSNVANAVQSLVTAAKIERRA